NRDAAIAALEQSFAHVKKALAATPETKLADALPQLGENGSVRGLWLLEATHVHEHLGQLIAYARMNGVVPPWSRPGG
ncbi:MAG: DinB family protein, partial [Longimicrobiales bacterium]